MKVKKSKVVQKGKSLSKKIRTKDCHVKLKRLSAKTIQMYMGKSLKSPVKIVDYNLSLRIKNGVVSCIGGSKNIVSVTITVSDDHFSTQISNFGDQTVFVPVPPDSIQLNPTPLTAPITSEKKYPLRNRFQKPVSVEVPPDSIQPKSTPPIAPDTREIQNKYAMRDRAGKLEKKNPISKPKPKTTTVAEIGLCVQKKFLWNECKKKTNKMKLIENTIVFAKQVL